MTGKPLPILQKKKGWDLILFNCIVEDQNGNLWIGTADGGVTQYDPANRRPNASDTQINHQSSQAGFKRFTENEGLSSNAIWNIMEDKKGNLWFATGGGGMCKYNGKSFNLFIGKEDVSSYDISSFVVKQVLEDKIGNIWFSTWGEGVYKFDGKYFTHFTVKEGLSHNNVKTILEDKNGSIWFGTEGGGISLYDPGEGSTRPSTFTHFTVSEGREGSRSLLRGGELKTLRHFIVNITLV